jgi:DNA primase catalytic core
VPAEADQFRDAQPADTPARPDRPADDPRTLPAGPMVERAGLVDAGERSLVVEITGHAWTWWTQQRVLQSWAVRYMTRRGLAGAEWGVAPPSWTGLSDHLQTLGYTPEQLVTAGVATRTRNGRLIDKFRNRIVFPYRDQAGAVVGVTARINPSAADERTPKYLNTPETAAYRKGELLLGLDPDTIARLDAGARPVLVEGPTDHAALQLAATGLAERTGVEIVPVAAGGTGVTEAHLQALRDATGRDLTGLIVALDADNAGRTAAARVWEMLTAHEAAHAQALDLPDGTDPAQAALEASETLTAALGGPVPLTWFAMEPNLQHIRSLDHSDRQISLLRALVNHLYDRVELDQWPALVDHVAQTVGDSPGAATHTQLDAASVRQVMIDHLTDRITTGVPANVGQDVAPGAEAANAAQPTREQVATDPLVQAWLIRHADLIATRLDALLEDTVTNPQLWMETITPPPPPPSAGPARGAWDTAMRQVLAYRDRYQVTDPTDSLGPVGHEGERGDAYAIAARAMASITAAEDAEARSLARSRLRPMERVPVVLADAQVLCTYERRRQEADEQARRDHTERERDRAGGRDW